MDVIKLGMIGLGTVGSGVLAMIQEHADKIYAVTGRRLILKQYLLFIHGIIYIIKLFLYLGGVFL